MSPRFTALRAIFNAGPIPGPLLPPFKLKATALTYLWRETVLDFGFHGVMIIAVPI